jgi:hypothetical protein
MSEMTRAAYLQEQMNKLKRTMNRLPHIVYVTTLLGAFCLAAGSYFGFPWLIWSLLILSVCTSVGVSSARQAKKQYNELLEQMKGEYLPNTPGRDKII